jgi:hypothetical protein
MEGNLPSITLHGAWLASPCGLDNGDYPRRANAGAIVHHRAQIFLTHTPLDPVNLPDPTVMARRRRGRGSPMTAQGLLRSARDDGGGSQAVRGDSSAGERDGREE